MSYYFSSPGLYILVSQLYMGAVGRSKAIRVTRNIATPVILEAALVSGPIQIRELHIFFQYLQHAILLSK